MVKTTSMHALNKNFMILCTLLSLLLFYEKTCLVMIKNYMLVQPGLLSEICFYLELFS